MKLKHKLSILAATVILMGVSCTDRFEEINTNPNKFYRIELGQLFPGTVYRTMNAVGELNLNYLMTWSRYATRQAFCGVRQDVGSGFYQRFYVDILRDLEELDAEYEGKEGFQNRHAIVKTWKAYVYYVMVSMYGGIPMSDAMLTDENKTEYVYDTEQQVYTQILDLLSDALDLYNPATTMIADVLSPDPVFGGTNNTASWRKFSNTLRLNIAMQLQNLDPQLSRTHATAAMAHEDWLISGNSENIAPHWGTSVADDVSIYWERLWKNIESGSEVFGNYAGMGEYFSLYLYTFKDPRMQEWFEPGNAAALGAGPADKPYLYTDTITRPHVCKRTGTDKCPNYTEHQADGLNEHRRDSILALYTIDYIPLPELAILGSGWEAELVDPSNPVGARYTDPLSNKSKFNHAYLKRKYVNKDATLPILTYTDACFLKAEAAILYGLGSQSAQAYYEEGIRASFEQYGISEKAGNYMTQNGVKWGTSKTGYADRRNLYRAKVNGTNPLDQIYKQRYLAGFLNYLEAWNLERRTRALDFPPFIAQSYSDVEGADGTYNYCAERLIYPKTEIAQNRTQYYKAIENLRAVSPWFREEQEGNNVFTTLGFAKKIPHIETADSRYKNLRVKYHADYLSHYYGETYEKMLERALITTGETIPDKAMKKAYNYETSRVLSTYIQSVIDF